MYSYFNGKIGQIEPSSITVEVSGIGYLVYVSNPYVYELNMEVKVYLYQVVKEDEMSLYGFRTLEEKSLFIDLISVKGIGPKSALAIVGAGSVTEIKSSIISENSAYLQRFPKIGKKSASQIILDLKAKFEKEGLDFTQSVSNDDDDVIEALETLGYSNKDIVRYLKKVDKDLSTEEKIKAVLIAITS